jgi:hypothetical protein
MPIPKPKPYERINDFLQRCMGDEKMVSEYPQEQRAAVCRSAFEEKLAGERISFDYDGTLSTLKGTELAQRLIDSGAELYIISARGDKDGMLSKAEKLGIPIGRIYAMGSNKAKIEKIKELNIVTHYDNNADVIRELGDIGKQFNN